MSTPEPKPTQTKIDVVGEINTSITYANFAKVMVTPFDAILTFACVDPATVSAGEEGVDRPTTVDASVVARIVLPHAVLEALETAIHEEIEKRRTLEASSEEA